MFDPLSPFLGPSVHLVTNWVRDGTWLTVNKRSPVAMTGRRVERGIPVAYQDPRGVAFSPPLDDPP